MSLLADVQDFVRESNRVTGMGELERLLESATQTLGFDYYALIHHVSKSVGWPDAIRLSDYPASWQERIISKGYFVDDPVFVAAEKSVAAFEWSAMAELIDLTPRHIEILDAARASGLGDGFFVPIHIPGEYTGSCRFTVRSGRELPRRSFAAAQYIGCFAFETARRMKRKSSRPKEETSELPRLTQRQFDCLVLAAKGKSDWEISRLLGISDQTVHKHMEESKRRYGVPTRMQLVVRALFNSHLTFSDVLH